MPLMFNMQELELMALDLFENNADATAKFSELTNKYVRDVSNLIAETLGLPPESFADEVMSSLQDEQDSYDASGS